MMNVIIAITAHLAATSRAARTRYVHLPQEISRLDMDGVPGVGPGAMTLQQNQQPSISLSAQAELELELSLRGSLLVQQQRRIVQLEDELQRAWAEIERLRGKLGAMERERHPNDEDGQRQPRYWTPEEHSLFVEAVQRYGWKDVKAISQHVGTRNPTQVRTHAQKLLLRQQKEQSGGMPANSRDGDSTGAPSSSNNGAGNSQGQLLAMLQDDGQGGPSDEQPVMAHLAHGEANGLNAR